MIEIAQSILSKSILDLKNSKIYEDKLFQDNGLSHFLQQRHKLPAAESSNRIAKLFLTERVIFSTEWLVQV